MKQLFLCLIYLALLAFSGHAEPPDISIPSPDQKWVVEAHWITSPNGYTWHLRNASIGKIYFNEAPAKDEALPARLYAQWTADSRYVAVNLYYGRRLWGVVVVPVTVKKPDLIDPAVYDPKKSLEESVLQDGDKYVEGEALTSADKWLNDAELSIKIEMHGHVEDKAGQKQKLDTVWSRVVRFYGASVTTISSSCDSYDKTPGD